MTCESIITLIISAITLVVAGITLAVAIMTYIVNAKSKKIADDMNKRDVNGYNKEVDSKAREFISKYNSYKNPQIDLLFAAIMAYKFNNLYTYKRQFYIDFNNLSTDVKYKVLELRNIRCDLSIEKDFYYNLKNQLLSIIKNQYVDEDFPMFSSSHDYLLDTYKSDFEFASKVNIDFDIQNIFNTSTTPLSDINTKYNWQGTSEELAMYIINITARFLSIYSINNEEDSYILDEVMEDINSYDTYDNIALTYEDEFLITLSKIYVYNTNYITYIKEKTKNTNIK